MSPDTWPFSLWSDLIWMWESLASSAGVGSRSTLVRIQPSRLKRKGKPMGDGNRLEPGRAKSLEGSTPSPSAEGARGRAAQASVFQTGKAGSTPAGHSEYPGGPARSGRHSLKVKIVGSNPIQGTVIESCCPGGEMEIIAPSEGAGPGSIPGRGTEILGVWWRHATLRRSKVRFDSSRGY